MNCTDINREFQCNILLVKALIQFMPIQERKKAYEWLKKLESLGDESQEAKIRNEYLNYLLINVQNGRMLAPFNLLPTCGKLRSLNKILKDNLLEDAMKQFKTNYCYLREPDCDPEPAEKQKALTTEPANFHSEQPRPRKGIIAHCSAFSNYEE